MIEPELEPPTIKESVIAALKGTPGFQCLHYSANPGWVAKFALNHGARLAPVLQGLFARLYDINPADAKWLKNCEFCAPHEDIVDGKLRMTWMLAETAMGSSNWSRPWVGDSDRYFPDEFLRSKAAPSWMVRLQYHTSNPYLRLHAPHRAFGYDPNFDNAPRRRGIFHEAAAAHALAAGVINAEEYRRYYLADYMGAVDGSLQAADQADAMRYRVQASQADAMANYARHQQAQAEHARLSAEWEAMNDQARIFRINEGSPMQRRT